jgi:hypothetical protein
MGRLGASLCLMAMPCLLAMLLGASPQAPKGKKPPAPSWPCLKPPAVSSAVPTDALNDQADIDCFAWQEFIALNWQALTSSRGQPDTSKSAASFGSVGFNSTVWETYKSAQEVFLPNGTTNPNWNQAPPAPVCKNALPAGALAKRRVLTMTGSTTDDFDPNSVEQAYPFNGPNWLADSSGNPVWYEMKLNQTEFNGIVSGQFYNAAAQKCIVSGGSYNGQTQLCTPNAPAPQQVKLPLNSMEMKATWRQLTDASQYPQYLTTNAVVVQNGTCTPMTLGLVGLHIVQKTPSQPNWIWATFEQVNNAPNNSSPGSSPYAFYNPACTTKAIPATCTASSATTSCAANAPPAYTLTNWFSNKTCPAYPVQVTRMTPVSPLSQQVNAAAQQMIAGANGKSVFQYYELIDAVWTTSPNDPYAAGGEPSSPLPMPNMNPGYSVANSVSETYIQTMAPPQLPSPQSGSMCINCHRYGSTAGRGAASDYSFLIGSATLPTAARPAVRSLIPNATARK